ncbi:MAG: hypothetical protein J7M32_03645 [Deltaproteobacteria bacterium]|nr:hypothetical protein [Deltaproteobacteria bacterium]
MKNIKRDLQSMIKSLKMLVEKAEKIEKQLDAAKQSHPLRSQNAPDKNASGNKKPHMTATDIILGIIKRQKKGIDTATLKKKTDFDTKTIRNVIFRLKKQGKIQSAKRGVYMAV